MTGRDKGDDTSWVTEHDIPRSEEPEPMREAWDDKLAEDGGQGTRGK